VQAKRDSAAAAAGGAAAGTWAAPAVDDTALAAFRRMLDPSGSGLAAALGNRNRWCKCAPARPPPLLPRSLAAPSPWPRRWWSAVGKSLAPGS